MDVILKKTCKLIDAVAHLGDGWDDIHDLMLMYPHLPLYAVAGNCDYGSETSSLTFNFASKKFVITHGHRYNVKFDRLRVSLWAEENEADVCLFGHTHVPDMFYYDRIFMINPGSIGLPRNGFSASYGIVDVSETGIINGSIMEKQGRDYRKL